MGTRHLCDVLVIRFCEQEEPEAQWNGSSNSSSPPLPAESARSLGCVAAVRKWTLKILLMLGKQESCK